MKHSKTISDIEKEELFNILKSRFDKNMARHNGLKWEQVQEKLESHPAKLWSLNEMEITDGEPDLIAYDSEKDEYVFFDCSPESPKGRRSVCYDHEGLNSRKEHKPKDSALGMAADMGIEILTEIQYRDLQKIGKFDLKTSSWVKTPKEVRELGGAVFCDRRYDQIWLYHNGAESYYAARGFRGMLRF